MTILLFLSIIFGSAMYVVWAYININNNTHEESIEFTAGAISVAFMFIVVGLIFTFGFSVFIWLKDGIWVSFSPYYLTTLLNEENSLRLLLTSEVSWQGVQKLNSWYLHSHLGWSFLCSLLFIFISYIYYTNKMAIKY